MPSVKTKAFFTFEELKTFSYAKIRRLFGGKALGLFRAYVLKLPVPKTWLFPIEHYEDFIRTNPGEEEFQKKAKNWLKKHFDSDLSSLSKGLYAVRSSSQYEDASLHSFAGIFESKLNVKKEDLVHAISEVWESCFALRVKSYSGEQQDLRMGVIIQPMVTAKFAGVAFSKHPSPQNVFENQNLVIEFAPFSGEKIVQGEVTPFRLSGTVESILSATDSKWVFSLLQALIFLKSEIRQEIDVEFIVDENETFWLLQERPISVMHTSHVVDLQFYQRKYKRSLNCLDIELLIEGCSLFLPAYLEIPYRMDAWMVMTTSKEAAQELWVHQILDEAVTLKVTGRIKEDSHYLDRIEMRYKKFYTSLFDFNIHFFFDSSMPLEKRFFSFCEFILPLQAHYYAPMFMIEALNRLLLEKMRHIDEKNCEIDLFTMGTYGIQTIVEVFYDELRDIKKRYTMLPEKLATLSDEDRAILNYLTERFGFLKCRNLTEKGYSLEEVFEILKKLPEKKIKDISQFERLKEKYITNEKSAFLLAKFREWMRIRNQEMEFLLYALLKCRPLFEEIARALSCTLEKLWNTSKESIVYCLRSHDLHFFNQFSTENLVIYRSYGKTRVSNQIHVLREKITEQKTLKGKTVYGTRTLQGKVKIAYSPKDLEINQCQDKTILVTGMTTPDFIPYLKKDFIALVTDEGGILCHAAIVAREIPIPCLVGTGLATEVLKDGADILIDFDRGEVSY